MPKTLNLQELFGQRERPRVIGPSGREYELRLPDEMDPLGQVRMIKAGERISELYQRIDREDAEVVLETLSEALAEWLALLNPALAEEKLGYYWMMRVMEFYNDVVGGSRKDPPEAAEAAPELTGETSSAP